MDITGVGRLHGSAFGRAPRVSTFRSKACFRNANSRSWWSGVRHAAASPSVDGGAGGSSGGGGAAGGGGGGDSGGDEGEERKRSEGLFRWKGWEDRVAADPQFPFKVFIEQVIGVGAAVVGDMSSRPNWGLNELDFVFSTLVVGSILNFSLMYLLAPTAGNAAAAGGLVQRLLSEEALKAMGAPGGHMFERGFSVGVRGLNLLYKGWVFGIIGLLAGVVGTGTSNGLLMLRKRFDPSFVLQNEVPNVAMNASAWCLHMGISSNVRYQILNGIDMVLAPAMSPALFKLVSTGYRTGNNVLGGISFVTIAKMLGAQKSAPSAESEASK